MALDVRVAAWWRQQVVTAHGAPNMLITTATVHAGASGGAVVGEDGALLGLVTSNARFVGG